MQEVLTLLGDEIENRGWILSGLVWSKAVCIYKYNYVVNVSYM